MRTSNPSYAYANTASEKYPRFIVAIIFETDSLYLTSHAGIANVPGIVIENVLTVKDAVSMRIVPDDGRSEIGVVNFDLLDREALVTAAFRAKHVDGAGLRGKKVVMYHGFAGADFAQFQVFQTQKISSCAYNRGVYALKCADIGREQRKEIFDPKKTQLTASIDDAATTVDVVTTAAFDLVEHGSSYSDGPDATVGYIKIESEIIRYTGKTSTQFTGCTRGVLETRAVPHVVDLAVPEDRRTEVAEVIYLELPAVKLILAILTGVLYDQGGATLPDHWHLGIDDEWVRESDFTDIGEDLWDLTDDSISFVPRFLSPKKTDGKRFLEAEVYQLIGCFPIIYADGKIGIKRMNRVLVDAPFIAVLDANSVSAWSELEHDMEGVRNDYQVQWNFDQEGKSTRTTRLIDGDSITMHGSAPQKVLKFQGLFGSRHTDATVMARLDSLRDRYAHPPELLSVTAMPRMNVLEVGDICRVRLPLIRDYVGTGAYIDRSMEIQRSRVNLRTGEVQFDLFGSTGLSSTSPTTGSGGEGPLGENNAPDDFYDSEGTELSSVVDMTLVGDVWVVDAGTYALAGNASMRNAGAIYYHLGDLTIPDGATLNLSQNVQIRVQGFLTINGDIVGTGAGNAGVADTAGYGTSALGTRGFGSSRGMDGIAKTTTFKAPDKYLTIAVGFTSGLPEFSSGVPAYDISVIAGSPPTLSGLPGDLRGTSGGPGGKITKTSTKEVVSVGGAGGDGGAGLCVICRGLAIGASGVIDLSGDDSAATTPVDVSSQSMRPGAGAPGCPGGLLIVLDGPGLSLPDLSGGKFLAVAGASGAPMANTMKTPSGGNNPWNLDDDVEDWEGFLDPSTTDSNDLSNSAYRIQYLPSIQAPVIDQPPAVPPPSNLAATGVAGGILLTFDLPDFDLFDGVEVYMATTNDRSGATKVGEIKATSYVHPLGSGVTRYFWIRNRRAAQRSAWEAESATGGASATST